MRSGRRERCTRSTTAYGHRRHLSRGRCQHHCLWLLGRRVCGPVLLGSRAMLCRRWFRQLWRPRRRRRSTAAALSFLLAQSLAAQQQEEEEAKEQAAVAELEAQVACG